MSNDTIYYGSRKKLSGKIITILILLMSTCIKASAQSPYAMFGDNSKMLEAKSEPIPSIFCVGIQFPNGESVYADFDLNKGLATFYDAEGNAGVMLGVFAQSDVTNGKGYVDIDWF